MDFYEELGVSPAAREAEIHRAYRRMVRLFHPDQYLDPEIKAIAGREMIRLNEMMRTLTDPERRRRYDLFLLSGLRNLSRPLRIPWRQRFSLALDAGSDRIATAAREMLATLSGTHRPLAATVFFACLMGLIFGWLQLGGIRATPEHLVSKASAVAPRPATSPRLLIDSISKVQHTSALRLHAPRLNSGVAPAPLSGY
jgi:curved DNA-binding protein CbpA